MITGDQLEQLAIQWFQDTGWIYVHGAVIAPDGVAAEREDFRAVVLKWRLAVRRRDAMPGQVSDVMAKPDHPSLVQSNLAFHRLRLDGKPWFHFVIAA